MEALKVAVLCEMVVHDASGDVSVVAAMPFDHGQLYTAMSRTGDYEQMRMYVTEEYYNERKCVNVVFREALLSNGARNGPTSSNVADSNVHMLTTFDVPFHGYVFEPRHDADYFDGTISTVDNVINMLFDEYVDESDRDTMREALLNSTLHEDCDIAHETEQFISSVFC